MSILKIARLFILKYAKTSPEEIENSLRSDIHMLWKFPNESFNVLKACAESSPKNPANAYQARAIEGFKFCQQLLSMIDYLKSKKDMLSLGELREVLHNIIDLIKQNMHMKFDHHGKPSEKGAESGVQFAHVSDLIFEMIPATSKHQRKLRDEQFSKAKTGLSRILSLTLTMLEKISALEMVVPEKFKYTNITPVDIDQVLPERFTPQRTALSVYDIIDFIRQHGPEYGISDTEDWAAVFRDNPQLKEEMTTVINAINRGHYPRGAGEIKTEISKILERHREKQ